MAAGGPYQDVRATPIAGIAPNSVMPGLPGQPNVFVPESETFPSTDDGLSQIMANDVVPASPPSGQLQQPAAQVSVAQQDALLNRPRADYGHRYARGRHGLGSGNGQFGWAVGPQDFNPNGYKPNESRSTQVGKYGGSPLYAATLAFPDAVIASRLQGIAKQKEAIAAQMAKFNPMEGVEDVKQPEYRDDFQRGYLASLNGHIDKATSMWGEEEGMKQLMNPNSELGRGLRELNMAWTTVARLTNQGTNSALAITEGMDSGKLEKNKYLYDLAKDQLHKTGVQAGNHDPKELAKGMVVFQGVSSLDNQVHEDGIVPLLKNAGSVEQLVEQVKKGDPSYRAGFAGILTKKTVNRDDVVNALTDRYYPMYENYMSRDDMKKYFTSIAGNLSEDSLKQAQIKSNGGGSGGGSNNAANYRIEKTELPSGTLDGFGNVAVDGNGKSVSAGVGGEHNTITLMGSANKQAKLTNPLTFRVKDQTMFMYPERIMDMNGTIVVTGKEVGMPRTQAARENVASKLNMSIEDLDAVIEHPDTEEAKSIITKFGMLQDRLVPLEGNEAQIEGLGYDVDRIKKDLGARRSTDATQGKPKAASSPAPRPPKAGAKFINGKWWEVVGGKVVQVK